MQKFIYVFEIERKVQKFCFLHFMRDPNQPETFQ